MKRPTNKSGNIQWGPAYQARLLDQWRAAKEQTPQLKLAKWVKNKRVSYHTFYSWVLKDEQESTSDTRRQLPTTSVARVAKAALARRTTGQIVDDEWLKNGLNDEHKRLYLERSGTYHSPPVITSTSNDMPKPTFFNICF